MHGVDNEGERIQNKEVMFSVQFAIVCLYAK